MLVDLIWTPIYSGKNTNPVSVSIITKNTPKLVDFNFQFDIENSLFQYIFFVFISFLLIDTLFYSTVECWNSFIKCLPLKRTETCWPVVGTRLNCRVKYVKSVSGTFIPLVKDHRSIYDHTEKMIFHTPRNKERKGKEKRNHMNIWNRNNNLATFRTNDGFVCMGAV